MSHPQPLRGAIVRDKRFLGVALGEGSGGVIVLPVSKTACRHRADVAHNEPLLCSRSVVRAGQPKVVRSTLTVLGRVSDGLVARIDAAMRRDAEVRDFEERYMTVRRVEQMMQA